MKPMRMASAVVLLLGASSASGEAPTLKDLADRYEQTQNRLTSFIMTLETRVYTQGTLNAQPAIAEYGQDVEVRTDGTRVKVIHRNFCSAGPHGPAVPREKPGYDSVLYDGKDLYQYSASSDPSVPSLLLLTRDMPREEALARARELRDSWKAYQAIEPSKPLAESLRTLPGVSLRDKTEPVNGVDCYVIDAQTAPHRATLWIDPVHDYQVVRRIGTTEAPLTGSWEVKRWAQFDGLWVPVETAAPANSVCEVHGTTRVTSLVLNPEHEALRSFRPDDIANGTIVKLTGDERVRYCWQDGELIPYLLRARGTGRVAGSVAAGGTRTFPSPSTQPGQESGDQPPTASSPATQQTGD